ncbi:MAG: hypothetical protein JO051_08780 [Acidobacteriaceae bacterium]|nr:hypothetical protein [Acidobacteriaceae bacterium]
MPCQSQTECTIQQQEVFAPQGKPVVLASRPGAPADARFVLFQSKLRVNTDGAPTSYHPDDPKGQTKAINNIANAISVRKDGKSVSYADTIRVFEDFRDHDWTVPAGYQLTWQNVLAARTEGSRKVPCVFTSGENKGYFGSLTALRNNLSGAAAGECSAADQLDERYVPALVIAGGSNPLKHFGVSTGDLLIALNPANGVVQAAVVGDSGPTDNLGEGSVALNMSLLKNTHQPRTYSETKVLDTGSHEIIVALLPKTAAYKPQRPFSAENITARVIDWLTSHGYESLQTFNATAKTCASQMNATFRK